MLSKICLGIALVLGLGSVRAVRSSIGFDRRRRPRRQAEGPLLGARVHRGEREISAGCDR